jgi:tripartite-type tricarboxylate transporter receptor subunit TctC
MKISMLVRLGALAFALVVSHAADAQQYPSRPVKIIVSIPPGGAPDISARLASRSWWRTGPARTGTSRPISW